MGATLIAILTAALLLPGIVGVRTFFASARTAEVDPISPPLSSAEGIALIGTASLAVHLVYSAGLGLVAQIPSCIPVPLANPYVLLFQKQSAALGPADIFATFLGLAYLCATAWLGGWVAGLAAERLVSAKFLYGSLADTILKAKGPDTFIAAYVLGKFGEDGRQVGYQGTVVDLIRDGDRFPVKVVLRDVRMFYLVLRTRGPERREMEGRIDVLALSSSDWHNIAFRVFRYDERN